MTRQDLDAACDEARRRLLEGLPAPGHLRDCSSCRAFEARLDLVDGLLATAPEPLAEPPPHLAAATLRHLARHQAARQRRRLVGLATLGAVLLGAAVWSGLRLLDGAVTWTSTIPTSFTRAARDSVAQSLSWIATLTGSLPAGLDAALAAWSPTLPTGSSIALALAALAAIASSWMIHASVSEG